MTAALQPYQLLIIALADGIPFATAATRIGMRHADAMREAKAFGWPDLDALRQAAADIRTEHPREETPVPPRTKHAPVPIEPDVEQAMTAGAALIREARASVALDRPGDHDGHTVSLDNWETSERGGIPADLDAVVDHTDQHETFRPAAGSHLGTPDLVVAAPEASTAAIDRELMDDTGAILQLFDRLERVTPPPALDREQRARAEALREAADITKDIGAGPTVMDLLELADFIITGTVVPMVSMRAAGPS